MGAPAKGENGVMIRAREGAAIAEVSHGHTVLALIVSHCFHERGIHFFTPGEFSQQLAYMRHPAGKVIDPHVHNPVRREVHYTQEVLLIKSGRLRVDFYDTAQVYLESRILEAGDVILLIEGGHGFEVLEEVEMIEVKQGPYAGDADKTRFSPNLPEKLRFR
jgi:mannose-6-phosphate isomerase-like protein (cupin superfamily)